MTKDNTLDNTFGPGSKIEPASSSTSRDDLKSCYVFFDQKSFDDFKKYCQENKAKLKDNEFIASSLTPEDIEKFNEDIMPDDLVMKIFIAINHTAGYTKNGHIGLKISVGFDSEFALKWFQLRATSAHIESYKDDEVEIGMSSFANIDGNIFGINRQDFASSVQKREDVVLAQLQSALSKIDTTANDKIKKSIKTLIDHITQGTYSEQPNDNQIKEATQAITYANLINAMYSVPEDSVLLYFKPHLFLPDIKPRKKCQLSDDQYSAMVQNVVNATERSIVTDKKIYQKDKGPESFTYDTIKAMTDIASIAKRLQEILPDKKLIVGMNGAVHQMNKVLTIENWQPTIGRDFTETKLAFEELMRKLLTESRSGCIGRLVKITAQLFDKETLSIGKETLSIGFAKYCDRQNPQRPTQPPVAEQPQSQAEAEQPQSQAEAEKPPAPAEQPPAASTAAPTAASTAAPTAAPTAATAPAEQPSVAPAARAPAPAEQPQSQAEAGPLIEGEPTTTPVCCLCEWLCKFFARQQ